MGAVFAKCNQVNIISTNLGMTNGGLGQSDQACKAGHHSSKSQVNESMNQTMIESYRFIMLNLYGMRLINMLIEYNIISLYTI